MYLSIFKTFRGSLSLENQEKTKLHIKSISGAFRKSIFGAFLKVMAFWKSVGSILALFPGANGMLTCF